MRKLPLSVTGVVVAAAAAANFAVVRVCDRTDRALPQLIAIRVMRRSCFRPRRRRRRLSSFSNPTKTPISFCANFDVIGLLAIEQTLYF